jgi:hypothetical protein
MPFVSTTHDRHHGKVVGTGHCVPFVREVTGAPITTQWRRGDPVKGSNLAPGTAIATFDRNGRYANAVDGSSHAAVFVREDANGISVVDQWVGQPVHERFIRFRAGAGNAANDADRFYVIEMDA